MTDSDSFTSHYFKSIGIFSHLILILWGLTIIFTPSKSKYYEYKVESPITKETLISIVDNLGTIIDSDTLNETTTNNICQLSVKIKFKK